MKDLQNMNPVLKAQVISTRSTIYSNLPQVTPRFATRQNPDRGSQIDIVDTVTGAILTVGLCDSRGAIAAINWLNTL